MLDRIHAALLSDPLAQGIATPLLAALILAGLIRLLTGAGRSAACAAAAAIAFLLAYALILGLPPATPRSAMQKIFYVVAAGAVIGVIIDLVTSARAPLWLAAVLGPSLGLAWLAEARLRAPDQETWILLAPLWIAGIAVAARVVSLVERGIDAPIMVLAASIGLGAIALIGNSASYAQLAFALAAATGGFLLWNWPRARFRWAGAGLLGATAALVVMAQALVLFSRASRPAIAALILIFIADLVGRPLLPSAGIWRPVALTIMTAVLAAGAVAIGWGLAGSPGY